MPRGPWRTASCTYGSTCGPRRTGTTADDAASGGDAEVDDLYGLPLEEFTKARDALARSRSKAGDKEGGAAVKALRKPSIVAWALNQLARRHPDDIDQLLKAGGRLRRAQMSALEGGDPAELREATKAEAGEVRALAGLARSILAEAGRAASDTQEERLAATLRAAAVDPEAGDRLKRGVLAGELSPAGFGFGTAGGDDDLEAALAASLSPRRPTADDKARQAEERERAEQAAEAAAAAQRQREHEAQLKKARAEAERLAKAATEAEERAAAARHAAEEALARVKDLEDEQGS